MSDPGPPAESLVVYKSGPARVLRVGDKLEIELAGGETRRVRPKDVTLLHPGPVPDLAGLTPPAGEVDSAWELLAGGKTTLAELAELAFGAFTPATAWAAWELLADGLLFSGTPETIRARPPDEVDAERRRRETRAAEARAWSEFLERIGEARVRLPEDAPRLADVEALALDKRAASRVLRALGRRETPENAHRLLLAIGHWDETTNPHPVRVGVATEPPQGDVGDGIDDPRTDFTHLPAFAIDDEGNTDPDDAVSLDGDRLWVHVADAASRVPSETASDREARGRGATLYLPERTVPMLPWTVIERLGLGLDEMSPALSFGLRVDGEGAVSDVEVVASRVRVTRLTYEQAQARLTEAPLARLRAFAEAFRERRRVRGAVTLELPEARVRVVDGEVIVRPLPRLESRALVTELMLMVGEAGARFAVDNDLPFPFTTQKSPENSPQPGDLAAMFAHRKRLHPAETKSAPAAHAGLGLEHYAQVTSPLRRYLDLVAHQQIRQSLRGESPLSASEVLTRIGAAQAVTGKVRRAERLSNRHWTLVYLRRNPGWRGRAVVVEKRGQRATVVIPELGMDAEVHVRGAVAPNAELTLALTQVDLPALSAHFRAET